MGSTPASSPIFVVNGNFNEWKATNLTLMKRFQLLNLYSNVAIVYLNSEYECTIEKSIIQAVLCVALKNETRYLLLLVPKSWIPPLWPPETLLHRLKALCVLYNSPCCDKDRSKGAVFQYLLCVEGYPGNNITIYHRLLKQEVIWRWALITMKMLFILLEQCVQIVLS